MYQSADRQHECNDCRETFTLEPLTEDRLLNNDDGSTSYTVKNATSDHHVEAFVGRGCGDQDVAERDKDSGKDGAWDSTECVDEYASNKWENSVDNGDTGLNDAVLRIGDAKFLWRRPSKNNV